jgi:hypothetical protein
MSTLVTDARRAAVQATGVLINERDFTVCLADGRKIAVPYRCFPRLAKASRKERCHFELYAEGKMLHWPEIDEDIEVQHVVESRMPVKEGRRHSAVAETHAEYKAGGRRRGGG